MGNPFTCMSCHGPLLLLPATGTALQQGRMSPVYASKQAHTHTHARAHAHTEMCSCLAVCVHVRVSAAARLWCRPRLAALSPILACRTCASSRPSTSRFLHCRSPSFWRCCTTPATSATASAPPRRAALAQTPSLRWGRAPWAWASGTRCRCTRARAPPRCGRYCTPLATTACTGCMCWTHRQSPTWLACSHPPTCCAGSPRRLHPPPAPCKPGAAHNCVWCTCVTCPRPRASLPSLSSNPAQGGRPWREACTAVKSVRAAYGQAGVHL